MTFEIGGPIQLPEEPELQARYLAERLRQMHSVLQSLEEALFKFRYAAPAKPREGDLAAADGTNWDPGAGKGLYQYINSLWEPLGVCRDAWTEVSFENSWANYGSPHANVAYFKDAQGFVHLQGVAKDGTATAGTVICTLPAGFRPDAICSFPCANNLGTAWLNVALNGQVSIAVGPIGNSWLYFNTLSFKAA